MNDIDRRTNLLTAPAMRCLEWHSFRRGTLLGFAILRLPSGIIINDTTLHEKNGRYWVSPPGKPKLDANGGPLRNRDTGKIDYVSIIGFETDQLRRRWSDDAVAAIRRDFPEAFEAQS